MTSNSILSSVEGEERWVLAMEKNFPQEHTVDIDFDIPFCVFRVPKRLIEETKLEYYAPQQIGLGPFHHLRPELYKMQKQKLAAARKFLSRPEKLHSIREAVEALVQSEPLLRACYDEYLDVDAKMLAWILAIDGLYLLNYLRNVWKNHGEREKMGSRKDEGEKLVGDIIMLENQIPAILLMKIRVPRVRGGHKYADLMLFEYFQAFCEAHSPLKLSKEPAIIGDKSQTHLLHRMYHLIVKNRIDKETMSGTSLVSTISSTGIQRCLEFLDGQGVPGAGIIGRIISFVDKSPWDIISPLFNRGNPNEQSPPVAKIDIPSVSQMTEIAGIKFSLTPGGIRNIYFRQNSKTLFLPVITLDTHSEAILRNLVAYEAASAEPGSTREIASYVDLMCGIIDSKNDVVILKEAKIIEGKVLRDDEIVRIFNGIRKSTGESKNRQLDIERAIVNVNKRYNGVRSVQAKRLLKKYALVSWKFIRMIVTIVVVVVLTMKAYCSVFGCARWFGKGITVHSNHLFYADQ